MSSLSGLSIRAKLLCAYGTLALFSTGFGALSLSTYHEINTDISQIRQDALERSEGVASMAQSLLSISTCCQELLSQHLQNPNATMTAAGATTVTQSLSAALSRFEDQGLNDCRIEANEAIALAQQQGYPDEIGRAKQELPMLANIGVKFAAFKINLLKRLAENHQPVTPMEANSLDTDGLAQISSLVNDYDFHVKDQLRRETENIRNSIRHANLILLSFDLLFVVSGGFLTWFIWRTISRPISILKKSAERIGRGDLQTSVNLPSHDEFGLLAETFNRMTRDLRSTTVSRDYVDRILKSMANTLIVLRSDDSIETCNEAALHLLGYDSSELLGKPMDAVLKSKITAERTILDQARSEGAIKELEAYYRTKEGQLIPVTFSASILADSLGDATGLICMAQDISARKNAEEELAKANRDLLETSRQAGMAEVATSVLHNVGNVLNSVNVSSALISEKVQNSKIVNLSRAMGLIKANRENLPLFLTADPKGKQLPDYLDKLTANLVHEQSEVLEEAQALAGYVSHIREIVSMQQNYARVSGATELLSPKSLMEDAVRINTSALERHRIKLVREYEELPLISAQKHKVLQILVNLLQNAKNACDESDVAEKQIKLGLASKNGCIRMSVGDNGVGIPKENLIRIFAHGFTTRKEGHGFGLHSGAVMAKEMGGALMASSDGVGHGATFTLELPSAPDNYEN